VSLYNALYITFARYRIKNFSKAIGEYKKPIYHLAALLNQSGIKLNGTKPMIYHIPLVISQSDNTIGIILGVRYGFTHPQNELNIY
jgi:hypothetical protein